MVHSNNYSSQMLETTNRLFKDIQATALQNQQNLYDSFAKNIEQYKHTYQFAGLGFADEIERTRRLLGVDEIEKMQTLIDPLTRATEIASSFQKTIQEQYHTTLESFQHNYSVYNQAIEIASQYDFSEIIKSFESYDFSEVYPQSKRLTLASSWKILSDKEDDRSLQDKFKEIHPVVIFFLLLICQIFFNQFNCALYSNFTQPRIESYLKNNNNAPKREKINTIKKLPRTINEINSETFKLINDNMRFITTDILKLRKSPSTSSEILDELVLGQLVNVISKKKNWIEVEYNYKEETMHGWIFTRYTAKFKK